jgi:ABC-type uncharacterized transport system ATPase subunit
MVILGVEGDHRLEWLVDIPGAEIIRAGIERSEIEIDPGVEPDHLLQAALGRGLRVTHFEIADPSLEQVFIDKVGRTSDDGTLLPPEPRRAAGTAREAAT